VLLSARIWCINWTHCRSQWPRSLRRGSAAACLLGLTVRIPPGSWKFVVSVVCCQVEFSATCWSFVQRGPTECGVTEYDHKSSIVRRPCPTGGCCTVVNNSKSWFKKHEITLTSLFTSHSIIVCYLIWITERIK